MVIAQLGALFAVLLFLAILGALEVGRRVAMRHHARHPDADRGTGAVDGAVLALLGLLIAFTFTGAAQRFDTRRQLVADEANAVGTALLRLDLLPEPARAALRAQFSAYLDQRLAVHQLLPDIEAALVAEKAANVLQEEIWSVAVPAVEQDGRPQVATLVLSSLNEMFDLADARMAGARAHIPTPILAMLVGLALLASLLAGYAMAAPDGRSWLHVFIFAGILSATIFVIVDLEFPRAGMINIDAADLPLIELRDSLR